LKSISIVIPALNEEETIGRLLVDLNTVIRGELAAYAVDVMVVDDGSTDQTAQIAASHGATVLRSQNPRGKGNALRYGFQQATGEYIVMLDGDYSHRPEDLPALIQGLERGAGLVVGSRIFGGSDEYTGVRAFGNIMLTYAFGLFHGRYLSDALNGFKAFRREVFFDHTYTSSDFEIEIELLANTLRSGLPIVEVPSHERQRAGGQAKSRVIRHGTKFLLRVIGEALKNRRDAASVRRASAGLGFSTLGVSVAFVVAQLQGLVSR
jgi:glycosyltransferase involved in cell wall biosynthesis